MCFADEPTGGQVVDLLLVDRWIEREVKVLERLELAKGSRLDPPADEPIRTHDQFVLQDQFQELGMGQLVAGCFSEPNLQRFGQPGQPQLLQRRAQRFDRPLRNLSHQRVGFWGLQVGDEQNPSYADIGMNDYQSVRLYLDRETARKHGIMWDGTQEGVEEVKQNLEGKVFELLLGIE